LIKKFLSVWEKYQKTAGGIFLTHTAYVLWLNGTCVLQQSYCRQPIGNRKFPPSLHYVRSDDIMITGNFTCDNTTSEFLPFSTFMVSSLH